MLGLGAATRVFVATGATDLRLGFDGLYALVEGALREDPRSGHLFLFANKRRDRMKVFFFDGNSLWVCARRIHPSDEDLSLGTPAWRRAACTGPRARKAACS